MNSNVSELPPPVRFDEVDDYVYEILTNRTEWENCFWYDVVKILLANTRMEDETREHLVWKDNGQRVNEASMDDEEKLYRIVKSATLIPTDLTEDCTEDWYINVHGLFCDVCANLFVPVYKEIFERLTDYSDDPEKEFFIKRWFWTREDSEDEEFVTWSNADVHQFIHYATPFHQKVVQEWNERKGRFAPTPFAGRLWSTRTLFYLVTRTLCSKKVETTKCSLNTF